MLKFRDFIISFVLTIGGTMSLTVLTINQNNFSIFEQVILVVSGGGSIILGFTSYTLKFLNAMKKGWPVKFD